MAEAVKAQCILQSLPINEIYFVMSRMPIVIAALVFVMQYMNS